MKAKRALALWLCGWAGLAQSLILILTFGLVVTSLQLNTARVFAKKGWL